MSIERAKSVLEVFEAALAVAPEQRESWLQQTCSDDPTLAAEVKSLLVAHSEADDFLESAETECSVDANRDHVVTAEIALGRQLGDFVVENQLGAGGMGLVYCARQVSLNRPVALKVLPPYLREFTSARERFRREVEAAARLRHHNIVAVYTTGEDAGVQYYAMELIDGPALSQVLEQLREQPPPELHLCQSLHAKSSDLPATTVIAAGDVTPPPAARRQEAVDLTPLYTNEGYFAAVAKLTANVADGLDYAHLQQIVHRDIKPSNLLFSSDGEIHISDFGLAQITELPGLTRTGEVIGTPFYMAPEQISAKTSTIDGRTDVYALGATLYELLTLQPPFPGDNRYQVASQITNDQPAPPRAINRVVPQDLGTICLKALEKQPSRRYQTASAMAEDLRRYLEGRPILARRTGAIGHCVKWVRRHRAWAAALLGMCCLAISALFFAYRSHVSDARWTDAQFDQLFEAAQFAAIEGDLDRASTAIDQAEELGATEAQLHLLRGQHALQAGQFQQACDRLELAVQLMPNNVAAHALLARAYDYNEENDKLAELSHQLDQLQPVTLQDFLLLGQTLAADDFDAGLRLLNEAVRRGKTNVVARLVRGSALINRAMDSGAPEHAEAALDDLRIAGELLEPNVYLIGRTLEAHLVAAAAYRSISDDEKYQRNLDAAAAAAEALRAFPEQYQSFRWRAFYFDFVGDTEQALDDWRSMQETRIAYLVIALFRLGKFDEALQLCDRRLVRYKGARFTEFFRAFILAARAKEPEEVLKAFEPDGQETLDALYSHRFNYIIHCLAGRLSEAQEFSRSFALKYTRRPHLLKYTRGELDEEEFLEQSAQSRRYLCQAHFYVGLTSLANGDRDTARRHFTLCAEMKTLRQLEDHMSRALLVQLEREPSWPPWIAAQ